MNNKEYILNPETNRVVLLSGRIGQQIIKKYPQQIETLKQNIEQKRNQRIKLQKCDYGQIWSSQKSICLNRKTDDGKKIVECHKNKIKKVLDEFKNDKLYNNNKKIQNKKQALAIALSEAITFC